MLRAPDGLDGRYGEGEQAVGLGGLGLWVEDGGQVVAVDGGVEVGGA